MQTLEETDAFRAMRRVAQETAGGEEIGQEGSHRWARVAALLRSVGPILHPHLLSDSVTASWALPTSACRTSCRSVCFLFSSLAAPPSSEISPMLPARKVLSVGRTPSFPLPGSLRAQDQGWNCLSGPPQVGICLRPFYVVYKSARDWAVQERNVFISWVWTLESSRACHGHLAGVWWGP